jgi:hypothetical protein
VNWTYFPVSTLPAPNEIVWCRFPHHDLLGNPGPYARPGLVRNTSLESGNPAVELVYGTTKLKLQTRKLDFFITKQSEMDACGLYFATRFDLDEVHWVPWADEWFETRPGYTSPIIGKLSFYGMQALHITVELRRLKKAQERAEATAKRRAGSSRSKSSKSKKPSQSKRSKPPESP